MDKQGSKVGIALLGDAPEPDLAAGGVLPQGQPQPGDELTAVLELLGIPDAGEQRRGGDGIDAGNRHQPLRRFAVADQMVQLAVVGENLFIECPEAKSGVVRQFPGQHRQIVFGVFQNAGDIVVSPNTGPWA